MKGGDGGGGLMSRVRWGLRTGRAEGHECECAREREGAGTGIWDFRLFRYTVTLGLLMSNFCLKEVEYESH